MVLELALPLCVVGATRVPQKLCITLLLNPLDLVLHLSFTVYAISLVWVRLRHKFWRRFTVAHPQCLHKKPCICSDARGEKPILYRGLCCLTESFKVADELKH